MNKKITVVTAFFDIGRENWTVEKGFPDYLFRTPDSYINYFKYLALLNNEMIIFTSEKFKEKILEIRENKPTHVVVVNYPEDFLKYRNRIEEIQNSNEFKSRVSPKQIINPEYWSPDYTLVTNLKSYFVKRAIESNLITNNLVAWIDFGYCRDIQTLNGVQEWKYDFDEEKVHFFTLKKIPKLTKERVLKAIFENEVFIIGGVAIASKEKWLELQKIIYSCQLELLNENIVDDDQGIYLMALLKSRNLIQEHRLGKNQWRTLFLRYDETSKLNVIQKIRKYLGKF
ncbi:WlaTC/HtrL family glycosyltransferase [Acinetobacter baumannii]|uniref:WlaTC/HtrL family glycosyltransferase n=1 Tax=Acinetobacter baumannii TaxID=470 RepID=UPI0002AED234|nr:WlaTC/HtrL family glycosyltransferase [Acinetobacter baumannii]ELX06413.1 putative protein YibB [Acinetobacter baumannii Naval-57]TPT18090.1 hypothetical protein FJU71_09030 [Acinetobacter baumannii]